MLLQLNRDLRGSQGSILRLILMEREPFNFLLYFTLIYHLQNLLSHVFIVTSSEVLQSGWRLWVRPTWTWRGPKKLEVVCASRVGSCSLCNDWGLRNSTDRCKSHILFNFFWVSINLLYFYMEMIHSFISRLLISGEWRSVTLFCRHFALQELKRYQYGMKLVRENILLMLRLCSLSNYF